MSLYWLFSSLASHIQNLLKSMVIFLIYFIRLWIRIKMCNCAILVDLQYGPFVARQWHFPKREYIQKEKHHFLWIWWNFINLEKYGSVTSGGKQGIKSRHQFREGAIMAVPRSPHHHSNLYSGGLPWASSIPCHCHSHLCEEVSVYSPLYLPSSTQGTKKLSFTSRKIH